MALMSTAGRLEMVVFGEELGEEVAVSVAQDECSVAIEELREVVVAAIFERFDE